MRWHQFVTPPTTTEALVVYICDEAAVGEGRAFADRWASIVPRSAFAALETELASRKIAFAPVQDMVRREAGRLGLDLSQIVLIGTGRAGTRAIDLATCNALADVHVIAVDLPPGGVVIGLPPARGAFRFVQHRGPEDPDGQHFDRLIHLLRESCLDIRTIVLPDEADPTGRAVGAYLVELVARASRYQPTARLERGPVRHSEDQI